MEKIDRRIRRTHKLLADALVKLSQQQGYDAVTIRDITDAADISYSTFFRRYPDKDALLLDMIQSTVSELRALIGDDQPAPLAGKVLFEHVALNKELYAMLLGRLNSSAIVQRIQQIIITEILTAIPFDGDTVVPPEVRANHVGASVLALVKWWLDHDTPYTPERMGQIYAELIVEPALGKR